jgi:hypothetical protein
MTRSKWISRILIGLLATVCAVSAAGQREDARVSVEVTVVDENGEPVPDVAITLLEPGQSTVTMRTDFDGHASYFLRQKSSYEIRTSKPGFYENAENGIDPEASSVRIALTHEQIVTEEVNVTDSAPGIDTQQTSDKATMNTPEIVDVPYQTSRDIRNLLPFNAGVVQDATGQVHVAGSENWETLYELDGFDIRSPVYGSLAMRVSADAVRTIDAETTRYPVEYGRATGGLIAFYTGMGDNKFRFNATNFIPSVRELNGLRFDKFVPRFTFSGPLVRGRAWFYDGLETEYDNIYISELPANADTDELIRGSNLIKVQANLTPANILSGGVLFNDYHSPYDGISSLTPQESTTKRNTIAWLPYVRERIGLADGALLDAGFAVDRVSDGYESHGDTPYDVTPELPSGSYFESLKGRSEREEGNAALYLAPHRWKGQHDLKFGLDLDHVGYNENVARTPISYLRENGTLLRESIFPVITPFTLHNAETSAYAQDRWQPGSGLLIEPGLRFDWDEIVRRPLLSPRIAAVYAPQTTTKLSAGIGIYYEHTQLEYLARALAGIRYDTNYAADGVTPTGPALKTRFQYNESSLREPRALNWSVGIEHKMPWNIFGGGEYIEKRTADAFTYVNQSGSTALSGTYQLTNQRADHYDSVEVHGRRLFAGGHTVFASYTRSSAHTNAALNYLPTLSMLGPQQSGPQAWDTPNRVLSWGWLPMPLPKLHRNWDVVYACDWHTGFPFTAVNANQQVIGGAGAMRFPDYANFSPGLEWRFHLRGAYIGLRGVMENATDRSNPAEVNNVVDSPEFGSFSEFQGRAFTARLRLIGTK